MVSPVQSAGATREPVRVAIVGASGYIGGEALRLLLGHAFVEVVAATSQTNAGQPVTTVHPHLAKLTDLIFTADLSVEEARECDAIFLALPHEAGGKVGPRGNGPVVFDLSGDFRIKDPEVFQEYYGIRQDAPGWARDAAYGLTEWNREAIAEARLIACPGCFPTGALLALTPLARAGLLGEHVVIDSKTGSSGSGKEPGEGTHHPVRSQDFRAYGLFKHRHRPEIAQELAKWLQARSTADSPKVVFTPHSAPMVRGIFTTAYVFPSRKISGTELSDLYREAYGEEHFVRLVENPRVGVVAHSNFCDISVTTDEQGAVIVTSAIDNLVKGGAGQGVQNMNLVFGLPEKTGLTFPGTQP